MELLTREQLSEISFASIGEPVFITDNATVYGCNRIHIGSHVRIEDFAVLSTGEDSIELGDHTHIAVPSSFIEAGKISFVDYCNMSSRVSICSSSSYYSGETTTNSMLPSYFKAVPDTAVTLEKYVIVSFGTVVLPDINMFEGLVAKSLASCDYQIGSIYAVQPAGLVNGLKTDIIVLTQQFECDGDYK